MIGAATVVALGVAVGPAIADEAVMWGGQGRTGAARVMLGGPGREPLLVL